MLDELFKICLKLRTNLTVNVVKTLYTENNGNNNSDARVDISSSADSFPDRRTYPNMTH